LLIGSRLEELSGPRPAKDSPDWRMELNKTYRAFCKFATAVFVLNVVYSIPTKLIQERLAEDWLHSVLHLLSAVFAAYAAWYAPSNLPARAYTWGIGFLYGGLLVYGVLTPGLFLNTPFVIPLGTADNVFHLFVSLPALVITALEFRRSLRTARR